MRTLQSGQFHGACGEAMRLGGLTLAESEYSPGHRLPEHAHEQPFFSLLLRGAFRETLERRSRTCVPTSLVFYAAHEPHSEAFGDAGGRSFNIELAGGWLARMRDYGICEPAGSDEIRRTRLNWLATRLYGWFLQQGNHVGAEELVVLMLSELEKKHTPAEPSPPAWLGRVRDRLHAQYAEVIRVTDLADEAGVHPVHLARVFRRHHGCRIGEYVCGLRLEHACAALADQGRPLSSIAHVTGFSDQAHFTRRFKSLTGMSPGMYRRLVTR